MNEDFLRQLAEYERMTMAIEEYEREHAVVSDGVIEGMETADQPLTAEAREAANVRAAELLKEIDAYKEVISAAQDAMASAEQELDALLSRLQ